MNSERAGAAASARLLSLDVFRGGTIAGMMLVNNPGNWSAVYAPLLHAEWHGWTFTDLIFPFFLWIAGVAIPLSTARRLEQGQTRQQLFLHALRRAAIIFALGLFLNAFSYFIDGSLWRDGFVAWFHNVATNVRIPGVLQRIAICYLAASGIFLLSDGGTNANRLGPEAPSPADQRSAPHEPPQELPQELGGLRVQVAVVVLLLAGYWLVMMLVPVPGCSRGCLEKEGNVCQYLDNLVLNGPVIGTHVWKTAKTWDPEGIFSTLPAIASCLFGVLTGHLLRARLSSEAKTAWLFTAGSLLLLAGQVMSVWLPINKSLWTSSYAVFMAGMAAVCFAVCYWLIDVQGWRRGVKPPGIYGMNAITVFVLAGVLGRISLAIEVTNSDGQKVALKTFLFDKFFAPFSSPDTAPFLGFLATPRNASLLWAVLYVGLLYLVAYWMYKRKWFVKL
jgi:predicted acyltransferase